MPSVNQYTAVVAQRCFRYPLPTLPLQASETVGYTSPSDQFFTIDGNFTEKIYESCFQWSQFGDRDERTTLIYTVRILVVGNDVDTKPSLRTRVRDVDNNLVLMSLDFNTNSVGTFSLESTPENGWPGGADARIRFEYRTNSFINVHRVYYAALRLRRT